MTTCPIIAKIVNPLRRRLGSRLSQFAINGDAPLERDRRTKLSLTTNISGEMNQNLKAANSQPDGATSAWGAKTWKPLKGWSGIWRGTEPALADKNTQLA